MKKSVVILTLLCFIITGQVGTCPIYAQDFLLPAPGIMVHLSSEFNPPILKGIKVYQDNPFRFDFILDKGDSSISSPNSSLRDGEFKKEATQLIKYFLTSLTIPEEDLWVNLSPYEKSRIVPNSFGLTEMGRDLLAEDYMLKQITASLIYPEDMVGRKFWKRVYELASKKYGTTDMPVDTFNKVWIIPEKAVIYENAKAGTAYVIESTLKVMLEQDYLSLVKHEGLKGEVQKQGKEANQLGSQVIREIIIPELNKEVNQNKNFVQLRQVYNSLILAVWYKQKIKDSILDQIFSNKNKVEGVTTDNPLEKEKIYQRYLKAFKKGVFSCIKEDFDPVSNQTIPRKYFSGGAYFVKIGRTLRTTIDPAQLPADISDHAMLIVTRINAALDQAMLLPAEILHIIQKIQGMSAADLEDVFRKGYKPSGESQERRASMGSGAVVIRKIDGEFRVLMGRRSPMAGDEVGSYSFPSGAVDPQESLTEGGLRKLSEEAGISKNIKDIVGEVENYRIPSGLLFKLFLMIDPSSSKDVTGNGEFDQFQWIPISLFLQSAPGEIASNVENLLKEHDPQAYIIPGLKEEGLLRVHNLLLNGLEQLGKEDGGFNNLSLRKISKAVGVLSSQDANVVFEKRKDTGKWIFRRGPIDLEIDADVTEKLGKCLENQGAESILIVFRNNSPEDLQSILENILIRDGNIIEQFKAKGIKATNKFKRVLLVAPYGDMEGRPLRYKVPSKGVEIIAHRILRETEDVDALVYNPNLSSVNALYDFVRHNHFDIIGISILQTVLKENLRILGQLSLLSPGSLFIAGGSEISKFPGKEIFESWPIDALSLDATGDSLIEAARNISVGQTKEVNMKELESVDNIVLNEPKAGIVATRKSEAFSLPVLNNLSADIPYDRPDLTHGEVYDKSDDIDKFPIAFDRIGRQPTRVLFGNFCKGKCIYCGTTLNTRQDLTADEVLQIIRNGQSSTQDDSVHFESADFFFDQEHAADVADVLAASEDVRRLPKLAIARVDEIGDGGILQKLSRAGFRIIAYGIESFDNGVLKSIGKHTTEEQNRRALDMTIQAGIKPGMNLILFTPKDTIDTTLKMIHYSLEYMERGAYINVVPYLFTGYGRAISRNERFLEYEEYDFPGLKKPFLFPRLAKNYDPDIARLKSKVLEKFEDLKQEAKYPLWAKRSVTIDSLLYFKSFILLLMEEGLRDKDQMNTILAKIDEVIDRTIRAEASTMKSPKDLTAQGVIETWFNTQNQLLTKVVLLTADEERVVLKLRESNAFQENIPEKIIFDFYRATKDGDETGESLGYVEMTSDQTKITSSQIIFNHSKDANVFIHRVLSDFIEQVRVNVDLLRDPLADSQKTISPFTVHYHRLPSEPLFGQLVAPAVYEGVSRDDLINQVHATDQEGYLGLAGAIYSSIDRASIAMPYKSKYYIPFNEIAEITTTPQKFLRPDLVVSDMDLTQLTDDGNAQQIIPELAEQALKYKVAAVMVYPQHIHFLPVEKLKSAGIKVGVVAAYPQGLGHSDLDQELSVLDKAVQEGADEVDFVMDFESILHGHAFEAERSLAKFAMGVEDIKNRYIRPIRLKATLETKELGSEADIRIAARMALRYADMIEMVSQVGQNGQANLSAARIMLEEILYYYKRTGILRGMKIDGGITDWDNRDKPNQSALNYYNLVLEVLGRHLGGHYLFERDLLRIAGYDALSQFVNASKPLQMRPRSHVLSFKEAKYTDLDIPTGQGTSLNIGEYLKTKFPAEFLEAVERKDARVEIYRGSATAAENYIRSLIFQGFKVEELLGSDKFPPHHKFYRIQAGQNITYLITGLIGLGRELMMVQALTRYYDYPENKITIRVFEEGGYWYFFNKSLGKYAGCIHKAVILHQIDDYLREISKEGDVKFKVVERIRNDFVDAVVIKTEKNEMVLLFEIQYTNSFHAQQVAEYFISPVSKGGLGIIDLTLHGAAGGVGSGININDLVVYKDVYWKGEKLGSAPRNDVDVKRLDDLLPNGVVIRQVPIYDIPTILNGSIALMDEITSRGSGAVELEVVPVLRAIARHRGVKFRAFYEIHDKPATTQHLDKIDAIGEEVPGFRDLNKRYATWRALAKYLFSGVPEEKLPNPSSSKERELHLWGSVSKAEMNLTGLRKGVRTVRRALLEDGKSNVVFLGQGEGVRYFSNFQYEWAREGHEQQIINYWDAREYAVALKQGKDIADLLAKALKIPSVTNKIIFVDNFDLILQDQNLRERFLEMLRTSNLKVIGYMPSRLYPAVESSFDLQSGFDHLNFNKLSFEVTREETPVVQQRKIVILGATGLVGSSIFRQLKERGFPLVVGVSQTGSRKDNVLSVDLTNNKLLQQTIKDADIVINAAVNSDLSGMRAGGDALEKARAVNVGIPEVVASSEFKGQFIQLSSYDIFGVEKGKVSTQTPPNPTTVFGQQKLMAEQVVAKIPHHAIIRIGPLFGIDANNKQNSFISSVIKQLDAKRQGRAVQPISTAGFSPGSLIHVNDVAGSIIDLIQNGVDGTFQISGENQLDAIQLAGLIADEYNKEFNTSLTPDLNIEQGISKVPPTANVQMYSFTTPDLQGSISDLIDAILKNFAMSSDNIMNMFQKSSSIMGIEERQKNKTGGIDLTAVFKDFQTQKHGRGIQFHLDPAMLQRLQNTAGFVPIIMNIQPMTNLRKFLGLNVQQNVSGV